MYELVSVAATPNQDSKYAHGLQDHFMKQMDSTLGDDTTPRRSKSGRLAIPWEQASKIMLDTLKVKKRLEYGR